MEGEKHTLGGTTAGVVDTSSAAARKVYDPEARRIAPTT